MRFAVPIVALVLAACSSGEQPDLPSIKAVRSAAAEWALVNRDARAGKVTKAYAEGMRAAARSAIADEAKKLTGPDRGAADIARRLQALPDQADPAALNAQVLALKRIEDALESA
ncbi:hypothetical protein ACFSCW_09460 [Sphingomonas tabacisoli]|uniref:Uncharacterized protein n=1 Tax=Sphingomonas tabacisoli TaxID=2249466 RepID=A0ABW4I282_9SPHN